MLFKRKASDNGRDSQQTTTAIFGSDVMLTTHQEFNTENNFPIISSFAPRAECDYVVKGGYHGLRFGLYFPVKAFNTERDYKFSHWSFLGCCVTLQDDSYYLPTTYALTGKPFRHPDNNLWVQNGKCKGLSVWSEKQQLSPADKHVVESLIVWADGEFAAFWSAQYAILIRNGIASIAFWEPELYDFESQLKMFSEALGRFPIQ